MLKTSLHLKNPLVLIHGLGATSKFGPIDYFFGLPKLLEAHHNSYFIPTLSAWKSIEERVEELRNQILIQFPHSRLNLIGHSMGGLDARLLASQNEFKDRIASVVTIGTPNQGSSLADFAFSKVPENLLPLLDTVLKFIGPDTDSFRQVTTQWIKEHFNQMAPDQKGVRYFSATSAIEAPVKSNSLPIFWHSHDLIYKIEGPNDGFVSVKSATWGEHIVTFSGDHYAQIGQFLGRTRGMDYLRFYETILGHLVNQDL